LALGEGTQFATDGGDLPLWHHHGEGFEVGGGHRALKPLEGRIRGRSGEFLHRFYHQKWELCITEKRGVNYLSIYLSSYLSIYRSIDLSIYRSIYLSRYG
jgi:hypothetical protein